jgi:putative transposase
MSRHPRPVFPDIPLHIIQRGNNRNPCFFRRSDYLIYLDMLERAAHDSQCDIHAYVLMPNHVHLLASPRHAASPALMMKAVGQRYVQYINRSLGRHGTLWQGRYRSCLVGDEHYFLVCQRYIELNPVRAALASNPGDYEWSSYRINAYGRPSSLITPHDTYRRIAPEEEQRQAGYRKLFADEISSPTLDHVRDALNTNFIFGSEQFVDRMRHALLRDSVRTLPHRR